MPTRTNGRIVHVWPTFPNSPHATIRLAFGVDEAGPLFTVFKRDWPDGMWPPRVGDQVKVDADGITVAFEHRPTTGGQP